MFLRSIPSSRTLALLVAAAVTVLGASFALVWSGARNGSAWDTDVYEGYGALMRHGEVPYRDFRVEYPPGALPTFALPSAIATPAGARVWEPVMNVPARRYAFRFGLEMIALLCATIALTAASLRALRASVGHVALAFALVALSPLLLGDLVFTRFDPWPAALTAAVLAALLHDRTRLAGVVLGIAIATKLYPALLLPLAVAWVWRRRGAREGIVILAATAATTAAVFAPFLILSPGGAWWPVREQLTRGLQGESVGASILSALHVLTFQLHAHGVPVPVAPLHLVESAGALHSSEILGSAGAVVGALSGALTLAVVVWATAALARSPASGDHLVRFAAVVLAAQLALGRVLSPQFVIWLLPIVPLVIGRRGRAASALLTATLLLTHLWFPGPYRDYVNNVVSGGAGPAGLLLIRNAVLVGLFLTLLLPRPAWASSQRTRAEATSAP